MPTPVAHQRHVLAMAGDVLAMLDQAVAHFVLEVIATAGELRHTIDDVLDEVEAIHVVQYRHVEGSRDRAFLLVAAHVQVHVVPAAVGEAMEDVSDRTRIASEALTLQTIWRTELALRDAGYSRSDIRAALSQLDERLAKLSAAADSAPALVHEAVANVRESVIDLLQRVDSSAASILETLHGERAALAADVRGEREAVVLAADAERTAIARDAARIADQVVKSSGEQARRLVREALLLLIVLAIVLLGLPFAAGYLVGRARAGRIAADGR